MAKREMLINYVPGEECRIAVVEDGKLEEFYQERASSESHVGNIYKGRVANVEPGIQAAFVDFGLRQNGFLHVTDVHPMYFPGEQDAGGKRTARADRPPIQQCLKKGQEVLVQVLKEGIGSKGPTVTSYLSIPGRFLVMMPHTNQHGVSRKVEDDDERKRMRELLDQLNPPEEFGFIIRTAGMGRSKAELKRDLSYLQRLWKTIDKRRGQTKKVGELYTEQDLIIRTIRDVFSTKMERIVIDDRTAAQRARDFLAIASPRAGSKVYYYADPVPLFHRYDLERQIERVNSRVVDLPSGGSLVIDPTEALVSIDVNSGRMRSQKDAETTAYRTNQEAADEICRQLRLRDLGGVVAADLIDMTDAKHRRSIEQRFRDNLKQDRARSKIGSISNFGILEMTRQRMRPSLKSSMFAECRVCEGEGRIKSPESVALDVLRRLRVVMTHDKVRQVNVRVGPDVAFQLLNRKRDLLVTIERSFEKPVVVRVNEAGRGDAVQLEALDWQQQRVEDAEAAPAEGELALEAIEPSKPTRGRGRKAEAEEETETESEPDSDAAGAETAEASAEPAAEAESEAAGTESSGESGGRRASSGRKRKRRSGSKRKGAGDAAEASSPSAEEASGPVSGTAGDNGQESGDNGDNGDNGISSGRRRRRRRGGRGRRRRKSSGGESADAGSGDAAEGAAGEAASGGEKESPDPAEAASNAASGDEEAES